MIDLNASRHGNLAIYASEMGKGMAFDEVAYSENCRQNERCLHRSVISTPGKNRTPGAGLLLIVLFKIKPILRGNKDGYIVSTKMPCANPRIHEWSPGLQQHRRTGKIGPSVAHADARRILYIMEEIQKR
ncbi:MAG: hypothetical protein ACLT4D_04240 [Blautia faecis]